MASIDNIANLGKAEARVLRKNGIRTTDVLLQRAGDRTGRRRLARETDLSESDLLAWAHRVDLMRLREMGPVYAELLGRSGAGTLRKLGRSNPAVLRAMMAQVNERYRLTHRLPPESVVERWVLDAAVTDPRVAS